MQILSWNGEQGCHDDIELVEDPGITVSIVRPDGLGTVICGGHAAHTSNNNIIGEAQEQFTFANGVSLVRDTNKEVDIPDLSHQ